MQNKLMTLIAQKMSYLSMKGQVISQNIANADTPGYHRRAVGDFNKLVQSQPKHAKNFSDAFQASPHMVQKTNEEINKEWEMVDYTEVSTDYQTVTSLYRRWNTALKSVIGKN